MDKKYFLVMLVLVCTLFFNKSVAQDVSSLKNATPAERAQFQTNMMKTKLNLDGEQTAKVQVINLKFAEKMQPIIKSDGSRFSRAGQAMALQEQKDTELQTVFTKDQFKQYKDFEAKMRSKLMARNKE